ncbi:MAG: hypothetical protein IIC52_13225 [Proteobacteria bacterium]|nr:hypothetical protein [Pseudomonadota bacterium]
MRTNRHVPLILGILAVSASGYLIFAHRGWWVWVVGALLLAFGIPSLKTGFFASDKEIRELTGKGPVGEETKQRFKDRL